LQKNRPEIIISSDSLGLYSRAASAFIAVAGASIGLKGRFNVALSGGSTPLPLYGLLASPSLKEKVRWDRVRFFWSDERCVAPEDEDSNYRGAALNLLDEIGVDETNIHRIKGELGGGAARAYEIEIKKAFGLGAGEFPSFDLMLLGLGEDGHTASIFPGSPAVLEEEKMALCVSAVKPPPLRVTLTPPVILAAREIIFLAHGSGKAPALKAAIEGPLDPRATPASMAQMAQGRVRWFVDEEAAAMLTR